MEVQKKLPRKDPVFGKSYFYAKGEDLKPIKDFRKDVYFPIDNQENIALVHYIGNENLSIPGPHGNSLKQTRLFFRTKPSVVKRIAEEVEDHVPHKIYKQLITEQPELPVNEATDRPRNVKQIANIRAAKTTELRISRDAIMNLHEMAYEENGFIWHITTYPDLIVLCGLKEVLDLLTETLSWSRVDTLLSYDTTFCLGEFYVSPPLHTNHQQITTQRRNPLADSHKHWMRWRLECLWFIVWWCARSWGPGAEHPRWYKRGISFTSHAGRVSPK